MTFGKHYVPLEKKLAGMDVPYTIVSSMYLHICQSFYGNTKFSHSIKDNFYVVAKLCIAIKRLKNIKYTYRI